MNNNIQSQSSASIDFYQFLSKHFFLLFSITYLSIVTITTISWERLCFTDSYSGQSMSSSSLEVNNTVSRENSDGFSTWFYTFIILGCSSIPWFLAYLFRQKALLINKKNLRRYPSPAKVQTLESKQMPIPVPVLATPKPSNHNKSVPSYRISASKSSAKKSSSFSNKTKNAKNIKLPFEKQK